MSFRQKLIGLAAALAIFSPLLIPVQAQNISQPANPDTMFCPTRGAIATRLANRWQCLTPGSNGQVLRTNGPGADAGWQTLSGTGTVTSVDMSVPSSLLAISGNPITTAGTLAITLPTQATNLIFAAPNGSTGAPTFRALAGADIPAINLAAGGAGGVTGTLPLTSIPTVTVAKGGTNAVTASGTALDNITGFAGTGIMRRTGAGTYTEGTLISVAEGGTNAASASGTALDNITGFASTGIIQRTGAGAYSFSTIPAILGSQTANTIYAAPSGSAGTPVFRAMTAADIPTSVALAGSPTTTTQAALDASTKIATTAYVDSAVSTFPGGPSYVVQTADQSVSGTSFTASNALTFSMAASTRYFVHVQFLAPNTNGQIGFNLSNAVTLASWQCQNENSTVTFANAVAAGTTTTSGTHSAGIGANTGNNAFSCDIMVDNITASTNFTMEIAQQFSSGSTTWSRGSYLYYKTF